MYNHHVYIFIYFIHYLYYNFLKLFFSFKPDDGVSELLENFSSFTSHVWSESGNLSGTESSLQAENQHLRVVLEKERYRRKVSISQFYMECIFSTIALKFNMDTASPKIID